jgi:hypothetical protein
MKIYAIPQPPYGPDSSSSDSFLFDDLKMKFKREELESMEELQDRVTELFGRVTSETMRRVQEHWMRKLNQVTHEWGLHLNPIILISILLLRNNHFPVRIRLVRTRVPWCGGQVRFSGPEMICIPN